MDVRALATDLDRRIASHGDPDKRDWWERYLKGVIAFHGVGIPDIRGIVRAWRRDHSLEALDGDALVELASACVALPTAEDKLAAIVLLQEHGLELLVPDRHLAAIARWFDDGHVADWNTCDWACVRVLGPLVRRHGEPAAHAIAGWVDAPGLWRRRAAGVAFVDLAPEGERNFEGFTALLLGVASRTVTDPARFAQTGTGWVLRELSKAEPEAVRAFVTTHLDELSREAVKMATARLPEQVRRDLLQTHNGNGKVSGGHAGR